MLFFVLTLLLVSTPAFADFDEGVRFYSNGDYERAFTEWHADAESGDAVAQRNLAHLYRWGKGVRQDLTQAAFWYFLAAKNGSPLAQYNLGIMYLRGEGVPLNEDEGRVWLERAAQQGLKKAKKKLDHLDEDEENEFVDEGLERRLPAPSGKAEKKPALVAVESPLYAHLASYYTQETLDKGWNELKERFPVLKSVKTVETHITLPKKGRYIRLYIKGKSDKIRKICAELNAGKQYCVVSYP